MEKGGLNGGVLKKKGVWEGCDICVEAGLEEKGGREGGG